MRKLLHAFAIEKYLITHFDSIEINKKKNKFTAHIPGLLAVNSGIYADENQIHTDSVSREQRILAREHQKVSGCQYSVKFKLEHVVGRGLSEKDAIIDFFNSLTALSEEGRVYLPHLQDDQTPLLADIVDNNISCRGIFAENSLHHHGSPALIDLQSVEVMDLDLEPVIDDIYGAHHSHILVPSETFERHITS